MCVKFFKAVKDWCENKVLRLSAVSKMKLL